MTLQRQRVLFLRLRHIFARHRDNSASVVVKAYRKRLSPRGDEKTKRSNDVLDFVFTFALGHHASLAIVHALLMHVISAQEKAFCIKGLDFEHKSYILNVWRNVGFPRDFWRGARQGSSFRLPLITRSRASQLGRSGLAQGLLLQPERRSADAEPNS